MNNHNRHMQYRRSVYRKRKIKTAVIISISAIVLVFALFLTIGTLLYNKTKPPENGTDEDFTDDGLLDSSRPTPAPLIKAHALPLLENGSTFASRLGAIGEDAQAVCITLNTPEGLLNYNSDIAHSLSGVSIATDASLLSSYLASISDRDLYAGGLMYLTALNEENDLIEDVELSISGALACEAIRTGVGDVLFYAPMLEADDTDKLCLLADKIHTTEKEAIIGIVISKEILNAENRTSLIHKLSLHFNYLCLDTTTYGEEEPLKYIEAEISDMQLDILYYKMRVLLPRNADAAIQKQYTDLAEKYNIKSWQILP